MRFHLCLLSVWLFVLSGVAGAAEPADEVARLLADGKVTGGLLVHIGCGDGKLTVGIAQSPTLLVHGLDTDPAKIAEARDRIRSAGRYGRVSIDRFDGRALPYADNLVRAVVAEHLGDVAADEVMRVLCPGGLMITRKDGQWTVTVKPRPADIDTWPQHLHDSGGNPVSHDQRVGPPRQVQWMAPPRYFRTHAKDPSLHFMLATEDRIFYNIDEGPLGVIDPRLEEKWSLAARDAYSGVLLWKRPLTKWNFRHWERLSLSLKSATSNWSAPLTLRRRAVASADRLYATLQYPDAVVEELDAATGGTLRQFEQTKGTDELVLADGGILLVRTRSFPGWKDKPLRDMEDLPPETVMAIDLASGKTLWSVKSKQLSPLTLAVNKGRVCYRTFDELACLDVKSGQELWRVKSQSKASGNDMGSGGALVMWGDAVIVAVEKGVQVHAAADGKLLWENASLNIGGNGFLSVMSILVADGLLWHPNGGIGYDPMTGKEARRVGVGNLFSTGHHVRCYRDKATDRFIIYPMRGIEFMDLRGEEHSRSDFARGACGFGIMPANGLLYVPPHPCHCYSGSMVPGMNAFASTGPIEPPPAGDPASRLEKGTAYGASEESGLRAQIEDWPMYRRDERRSGATPGKSPTDLAKVSWQADLGGALTPPVVAGGRLLIAVGDRHEVQCLDAATGKRLWGFVAGGRIDSSPTVAAGQVYFGCTDGWLYVLRLSDGALAWRFRAAPMDRRIVVNEQVESAWPVHGSVIVRDGTVYCTAGRSSYLDGGIYAWALDAATGEVRHQDHLDGPWPDPVKEPGFGHFLDGTNSDLLVVDAEDRLNMLQVLWDRQLKRLDNPLVGRTEEIAAKKKWPWMANASDEKIVANLSGLRQGAPRLIATNGFLEDPENPRTYWIFGRIWPGFNNAAKAPAQGIVVCFDDANVYGAKVFRNPGNCSMFFSAGDGTEIAADALANEPTLDYSQTGQSQAIGRANPPVWTNQSPMRVKAMVAAGNALVVAGPPDVLLEKDNLAPFEGRSGGRIKAMSKTDGTVLSETELASPPVFDGMAVAAGRLYVATIDGRISCYASK